MNKESNPSQGLVIAYFGSTVAIETSDGQIIPCQLHRNQVLPVVGDIVHWQFESTESGVITAITERRSLLTRQDSRGRTKPLASNIDAIVIVMAPPPILSEYLLDKYITAAELMHIQPFILLNKMDLLTENTRPDVMDRLSHYQKIPYEVHLSSIYMPDTLVDLNRKLEHKTAVLVGPSGVGKSSIIAALGKPNEIKIGEVSPKGAGKHTTTATRLYHLPYHSQFIDSPGVREFHLGPTTQAEILYAFKEFKPFVHQCKFRDCIHLREPHCGVQKAVADGKISQLRYDNYQLLINNSVKKS